MAEMDALNSSPRILSMMSDTTGPFWTSGRDGILRLLRRVSTGRWLHPMEPGSVDDLDLTCEPVSGNGRVFTFTINRHAYNPAVPPPYVVALIQLDEQEDLRIPSNIVNCAPDEVEIGMRVRVLFERQGDAFVPVFEPVR